MSILLTALIVVVLVVLGFILVGLLKPADPRLTQLLQALIVAIAIVYIIAVLMGKAPAIA